MATQIPIPLPVADSHAEDDFMVTPSNAEAAQLLQGITPRSQLLLGPQGSGKTHLAHIWQKRSQAVAINAATLAPDQLMQAPAMLWDDADGAQWSPELQRAAFHLLNMAREQQKPLLITAATPPLQWNLQLADLRSRLLALPVATIQPPDDALVASLLLKHLKDRQLKIGEDVLNYLIPRLPRDGGLIMEMVNKLDVASLADKRSLTIPFIKSVFE